MVFDLDESMGYQLARTGRLMAGALAERLAEIDLTPQQWAVLQVVDRQPGRHQQHVADRLGADRATVTELVTRLTRRGLLTRSPDPDDARRLLLYPGPRMADGDLLARAEDAATEVNALGTARLSPSEHRLLLDLLRRVRETLDPRKGTT